jgi:hypothetical protein
LRDQSTVTITYFPTYASTPDDPASISYIDPTTGLQLPLTPLAHVLGPWQIPANKQTQLQIQVRGPIPTLDTCGIDVNGQRATGQGGNAGDQPDSVVTCNYLLLGNT